MLATASASAEESPLDQTTATNTRRFAVVIGQADYRDARLATGTADASRMADALQSAGFSVDGGADLEQQLIREKIRALIEKASQSADGAETILVYLGGRVAQFNGENLLLPVGAPLDRSTDVVLNGFRLNDLVSALKLVPAKARILIIDAAAPPEHLTTEKSFSPGLAIINAPEGFLIVFNQNPGRPLIEPQPPMGLFLKGFLDALQQPVASYSDSFALVRQRVFDESQNHELPWQDDKLSQKDIAFYAPPAGVTLPTIARADDNEAKLASLSRDEAFKRVVASDSILDYQAFLVRFPKDEAVPVVQYNLAVRREAEVWSHALQLNTPQAYWTYINNYPDGGNVGAAREKLARLNANASPPDGFKPVVFDDIPPPLPQMEMVASSASMPIEYMPPPPKLVLEPISPVVAAAAALPVAAALGRQLPRSHGEISQPSWSPIRTNAPTGAGGGGPATFLRSPAISRGPGIAPIHSGASPAPLAAPKAGTVGFKAINPQTSLAATRPVPGGNTFRPISNAPVAGTASHYAPSTPAPQAHAPTPVRPSAPPITAHPGFSGQNQGHGFQYGGMQHGGVQHQFQHFQPRMQRSGGGNRRR
ncbi:caspase family protein [Rhodoblastus acidophilus]|uniref:caspase family protein n=1 Tax=Rhodoblastus acidophilus TaxID=1074 RepID=UPI002224D8AA|nr:caspase family protein [Rhodoblastus acidophilus]